MHSVRGITPEGKKVNIKLRVNKKYERSPTITEFSEINQSENNHFCKSDPDNSVKNRHGVLLFTNCYRDPIRKTSNDRFENYISSWGTVICTDKESPDFIEGIGRIDIRKGTDEVADIHDKIFTSENDDERREYLKALSDHSEVRLPLIIYRYRLIRRFHLSNIDDAKEYVKHITTEILNKNVGCGFAVRLLDKNHQIYKNSYREIFQNFIKDENRLESPEEMVDRYFSTPHAISLLEHTDHDIEIIPLEKVFSGKKTTRHYLKKNNYKMIRSLYTTSSYGFKVCHVISKPFRFRDDYTGDERLLVDRVFSMSSPIGHPMRLTVDGNCNMTMAGENPNGYDYSSVFKVEFPSKRVELKRNAFIYQLLTSGTVEGFTSKEQKSEDRDAVKEIKLIEKNQEVKDKVSIKDTGKLNDLELSDGVTDIGSNNTPDSDGVTDAGSNNTLDSDDVTDTGSNNTIDSDGVTASEHYDSKEQEIDFTVYENESDKIERVDEIKQKAELASEVKMGLSEETNSQFEKDITEELSLPNKSKLNQECIETHSTEALEHINDDLGSNLKDDKTEIDNDFVSNETLPFESKSNNESSSENTDKNSGATNEDINQKEKDDEVCVLEQKEVDFDIKSDEIKYTEDDSFKIDIEKTAQEVDCNIDIEDSSDIENDNPDTHFELEGDDETFLLHTGEELTNEETCEKDKTHNFEDSFLKEKNNPENNSQSHSDDKEIILAIDEKEPDQKDKGLASIYKDTEDSNKHLSDGEEQYQIDTEEKTNEIPVSLRDIEIDDYNITETEKKEFPLVFDDLEQYESYISSSENEEDKSNTEEVSEHCDNEQSIDKSDSAEEEKSEGTDEDTSDEEPTGMAAFLMGF